MYRWTAQLELTESEMVRKLASVGPKHVKTVRKQSRTVFSGRKHRSCPFSVDVGAGHGIRQGCENRGLKFLGLAMKWFENSLRSVRNTLKRSENTVSVRKHRSQWLSVRKQRFR